MQRAVIRLVRVQGRWWSVVVGRAVWRRDGAGGAGTAPQAGIDSVRRTDARRRATHWPPPTIAMRLSHSNTKC